MNIDTHEYILSKSLSLLKKFHKIKYKEFLTKSYYKKLIKNSGFPDLNENDFGSYCGHFYNPDNGLNYIGSKDTAYSRFKENYKKLIKLNNYNSDEFVLFLGKAIHYASDICCPHHSANKIGLFTDHIKFEQYLQNNISKYCFNKNKYFKYFKKNKNKNIFSIIKNSSRKSKKFYFKLTSSNYSEITNKCNVLVFNTTLLILYKVYKKN